MNERIKYLRKDILKKTQDDFSSKIGLSRNFIAQLESGAKIPSDRTISDICRVYNVNEEWLRTGAGEMFIEITRDEQIATFIGGIQAGNDDSFKKRFISMLAELDESEWEVLEKMALKLHAKKD